MESRHYTEDRKVREQIIQHIGLGTVVATFTEPGRRYGDTIRVEVSSTAIVSFYVEKTNVLITRKIARPKQLIGYFGEGNVPMDILDLAIQHKRQGLNEF